VLTIGTKNRREREKENMRLLILEAASKIIINDGYENLSMRKVAEAIDYSATMIYSYYKHKAEIVEDISQKIYKEVVANIVNAVDENAKADKQLELCFCEFINTITANPEMGKAVILSGTGMIFGKNESPEPPEENGILLLSNLLAKGQQENTFRSLDENTAWMLVTALIGFSMNALQNQLYLHKEWQNMVDLYVEMLIKGIKK